MPPKDNKLSWTVAQYEGGWYYYDYVGEPYGPYETEEFAWRMLDDYEQNYDRTW